MTLSSVLLAFALQGKVAKVEAAELVRRSNACVVVKPEKGDPRATVTRVIWGSELKPGDRIRLKGLAFGDFVVGSGRARGTEVMSYQVGACSLVFLEPAPRGTHLASVDRFAELPMITFSNSSHDCQPEDVVQEGRLRNRLAVGGVLFSPLMKHSRKDSVSLNEVIAELRKIRRS